MLNDQKRNKENNNMYLHNAKNLACGKFHYYFLESLRFLSSRDCNVIYKDCYVIIISKP